MTKRIIRETFARTPSGRDKFFHRNNYKVTKLCVPQVNWPLVFSSGDRRDRIAAVITRIGTQPVLSLTRLFARARDHLPAVV